MKASVLCLTLGVVSAFGGSREASIRLYTHFQQQPPDAVLESLQEELANIMLPMGLGFEWRSLDASKGNEVSAELAVIHFKGRCDTEDLQLIEGRPGPLGWTHISEGEILPFSDINCDGLRLFLQRDLLRMPENERPAAFGRAVGRVLAHELYHVLAKTAKHGSWGIAKAAYTPEELLSPKFLFEKKESKVLRAHEQWLETTGAAVGEGE